MQEKIQTPPCKRCGARTVSRGIWTFAIEPHQRRKVSCTVCGHTFVPKEEVIQDVVE